MMDIENETPPAAVLGGAVEDDRPVVRSRSVDLVVSTILLAFAVLMGWDNWRTGASWASDGPEAGYFPFYLSVLLGGASLVAFFSAATRRGTDPGEPEVFVTRDQFRRVLQVLVPTLLYVLLIQVLGLYLASFILVAGFMRAVGRIAWWKSLLTSFIFAGGMFLVFEVAFNVIMPKGPLEAAFGY
jgi:putative tricarboxylic transport membrane protein